MLCVFMSGWWDNSCAYDHQLNWLFIELLFTSHTQDKMWKREKMWMIKRKSHLACVCLIDWMHIIFRECLLLCSVCVEMSKCVISLLAPTEHPKECKYRPVLEVFPFTNTFTLSMKLVESPVLLTAALFRFQWTPHTYPGQPWLFLRFDN